MDWYRGGYMHPKEWVPWMEGAERNYRNVQSTICHVSSCLLWDFALTPQAQESRYIWIIRFSVSVMKKEKRNMHLPFHF